MNFDIFDSQKIMVIYLYFVLYYRQEFHMYIVLYKSIKHTNGLGFSSKKKKKRKSKGKGQWGVTEYVVALLESLR